MPRLPEGARLLDVGGGRGPTPRRLSVPHTQQLPLQVLPAVLRALRLVAVYSLLGLPERHRVLLDLAGEADDVGVEGALDLDRAVRGDEGREPQSPVDLPPEVGREVVEPEPQTRPVGLEYGPPVVLSRPGLLRLALGAVELRRRPGLPVL